MTKKLYNLMNWPKIEEIIYSECDNPHDLLGPHKAGRQTLIQAYFPGAESVFVEFETEEEKVEMEPLNTAGDYKLVVEISGFFGDSVVSCVCFSGNCLVGGYM